MASNPKRIDKTLFSDELKAEIDGKRNATDSIDWTDISNKPQLADGSWRTPVATSADLPATGNTEGDIRLVLSDRNVYSWKSGVWDLIGANDTNIDWTAIQSKPSTFPPSTHGHTLDDVTETATKKIMSDTERTKLAGVEANSNNYVHPDTHPATMITEDSTHRFATDTEKSEWSGKADSTTLTNHTGDTTIHITSTERTAWNGKAEASTLTNHINDTTIHHSHSNKSTLDKVAYTGTQPTIDLIVIEQNASAMAGKVDSSTFSGHTGNTTVHITQGERDAWNGKQSALGYTPENPANKGVTNGYASLDATGKVPIAQLPPMGGSGDMMAATYDPDGDGKVTSAVSADSVPWTGVSGKPDVEAHMADTVIHITQANKDNWNGKVDSSTYSTHVGDTAIHHTHSNKASLDLVAYSGASQTVDLKQIETNTSALSGKVDNSTFSGHTDNTTIHVTQTDKDSWNGKQSSIAVSSAAPATPLVNQFWVDTTY